MSTQTSMNIRPIDLSEPWIFAPDITGNEGDWTLRADDGSKYGGDVVCRVSEKMCTPERRAALVRAAACVNALAGMNPAALAGVVGT